MTKEAAQQYEKIIFLDLEVDKTTKKINQLGMVYKRHTHNATAIKETINFIKLCNAQYICGHNIIDFDLEMSKDTTLHRALLDHKMIDTLPLSLLLFSEKSIHALPKNYKQEDDFKNDPVEDSKLTAELLLRLERRFLELDKTLRNIFYSLLKDQKHFHGFFVYMAEKYPFEVLDKKALYGAIIDAHEQTIRDKHSLKRVIKEAPVELAYILALIAPHIEVKSHPPRILYLYKEIVTIQKRLCFDLAYEKRTLSDFSKETFGFGSFRIFPKLNPSLQSTQISQKEIIEASLKDESFLAVLPTGGGKTFTFWLPAIIKARRLKSLTVVISPLQALIEDHVTSFGQKVANYKAVAISGYMSPLQRSEAIEQVINGEADILYLAPESLRSNMIFNVLKNRLIERFVVDEAHCLSTWGNDFRQDYYYICEYIRDLLEAKGYQEHIPISCFTATAKKDVINDIKEYFKEGLQIELDEYLAKPERKNLKYKALPSNGTEKYPALLKLISEHDGATLVYIPSSTKECDKVADRLAMDTGKTVRSFHSKLDAQVKMQILKEYIDNEIDVVVATTAFGMGVDKADITNVIHYEVSDSLENYAQEAGRGGRDEKLEAFCPVLFDEKDLDKHFVSLNRSKITAGEINSVFRVIKKAKGDRVVKTAFEIALQAGWDVEDSALDYTTKIKTALLELEREGYISRKRNKVSFFADSVAAKSMEKLHEELERQTYEEEERSLLVLVLQHILHRGGTMSVQVDELAYLLGANKADIALAIHRLKELDILGDSKDLSLIIHKHSLKKLQQVMAMEKALVGYLLEKREHTVTIKELHSQLHERRIIQKNRSLLVTDILRNLRDKGSFSFRRISRQYDVWEYKITDRATFSERLERKHAISEKAVRLFMAELTNKEKEAMVEFSLKGLREKVGKQFALKSIDKALLYLHHVGCVELRNGRFIHYAPMVIHKKEKMKIANKQYTKADYKHRLEKHYRSKVEAIHIMGEYGQLLQKDDAKAGMFLTDYFSMDYTGFKRKYKLLKEKITRPITQQRFNKIFSEMSDEQKAVIEDRKTKAMMILAGPGSGKTKVLVHKIASLILMEDIKPEQFLMLTFSRTAANEFRSRLYQLVGELSYDIEIYTFHAYALKLIGRMVKEGDETLNRSIVEAAEQIRNRDIALPLKSVLVLDEYQDINQDSFGLVDAIYRSNQEMRIIAVGDDDQCIMGHIGADPHFFDRFQEQFGTDEEGNENYQEYELSTNFRSAPQIVSYSNHFIKRVKKRHKLHPLSAQKDEEGQVTVRICLGENLIAPAVEQVAQQTSHQSTAVLARTNKEVMQIYAALHAKGIGAKYILDRDGFSLKDVVEIVYFDQILTTLLKGKNSYAEADFFEAYKRAEVKFKGSKNLPLLEKVIDKFLAESLSYHVSQWLAYLDEIRLEDFESYAKAVTVSTIHKSKGMEFENVIMIVRQIPKQDQDLRLYYVGMTRAKKNLTIVYKGRDVFHKSEDAVYAFDATPYDEELGNAVFIMGLQDIRLSFKGFHNDADIELLAGEPLKLQMRGKASTFALIYKNRVIDFLSKAFHHQISSYLKRGYRIQQVEIEYVVVWYYKEHKKYLKHPLCRISLRKE